MAPEKTKQIDAISYLTSAGLAAPLRIGICEYVSRHHGGERPGKVKKTHAEWQKWLKAELGVAT